MSDDAADAVLAGIEALATGGMRLKPIINDERTTFDGDGNGDRTEDAR